MTLRMQHLQKKYELCRIPLSRNVAEKFASVQKMLRKSGLSIFRQWQRTGCGGAAAGMAAGGAAAGMGGCAGAGGAAGTGG